MSESDFGSKDMIRGVEKENLHQCSSLHVYKDDGGWRKETPSKSKKRVVRLREGKILSHSNGQPSAIPGVPSFLHDLKEKLANDLLENTEKTKEFHVKNCENYWVFSKQDLAFNFIDEMEKCNKNLDLNVKESLCLRVLAMELSAKGVRQYVVWDWSSFENYYVDRFNKDKELHWYEVIREGCPCRLYFDVEFDRVHNPLLDGNGLVFRWIDAVTEKLKNDFNIHVQTENVTELDSTTSLKFSRHLIIHLPNKELFENNQHVGNFVNALVHQISNQFIPKRAESDLDIDISSLQLSDSCEISDSNELNWLLVKSSDNKMKNFVDTSVYTKNRCFRLAYSSKFGKKAILRPCEDRGISSEDYMQMCNLLKDSLVVPIDISCSKSINLISVPECATQKHSSHGISREQNLKYNSSSGLKDSPFPLIDSYIESYITRNGFTGYIRKWEYYCGTMTYQIGGYRWCGNIGRQHKSNNIILVVNLRSGMLFQKCFDEECRRIDYRSTPIELNSAIIPAEDCIEDLEYDLIIAQGVKENPERWDRL